MEVGEFLAEVEAARQRDPVLFDLPSEPAASAEEMDEAERQLSVRLPSLYRWFLGEYGAGFFALTVVYSLARDSDDSVWDVVELPWIPSQDFFPIADNGAGDYYGFRVDQDGLAGDEVYILDHELGAVKTSPTFPDFLEFLASVALARP